MGLSELLRSLWREQGHGPGLSVQVLRCRFLVV